MTEDSSSLDELADLPRQKRKKAAARAPGADGRSAEGLADRNRDLEREVEKRTREWRRMSQVFRDAADPMLLHDAQGEVIDANREVESLLGWTRDQLIGRRIDTLLAGEYREMMKEATPRFPSGGPLRGIEAAVRAESGEEIPVLLTISQLSDEEEGGAPVFAVIAKDIRSIKESERALRESRALAETHRDIAYMANAATSVEEAFTFCLKKVAYYNRWSLGHAWFPSPDDPELLVPVCEHYAAGASRFRPFRENTMALAIRRGEGFPGRVYKGGKMEWTCDLRRDLTYRGEIARSVGLRTAVAFPILVGRRVAGVLEFFSDRDIVVDTRIERSMASVGAQMGRVIERIEAERALKERESWLRQLTEQIRDVVWLRDARTATVFYCNRVFEKVFGRSREILEQSPEALLEFVHEKDRDRVRAANRRLRTGASLEEIYRYSLPDGSLRWLRERAYPILNEDGRVFRFAHTVEDITERRRTEQALGKIDARISDMAEQQRRRIARDLHDSLGGLLSAVDIRHQILVDAMAEGRTPNLEDAETVAGMIREAITEARRLTRGLRPIGDDPENLAGALGDLAKTVRAHSSMNCRFHCHGEIGLPDTRTANELFRIAQEAANNAVKHSGASHLTLTLKHSGSSVVLTIMDNGVGIDSSKPREDENGGFGLEIMKHRARSVGGKVEIAPRKDRGTMVVCTVPAT